jgi:hypothetical protein
MQKKLLVVVLGSMFALPALAADAEKTNVPTLSQILDASGISVSGYFDVAYNKMNSTGLFVNNTGPASSGLAGNSHIFDTPGAASSRNFNGFNLQQAALIVSKQPKEGFGGYLNVTAGQDAGTIASTGLGAVSSGSDNSAHSFDLTQAYASYAAGALTVIGGKFATLAGAELITSPSNKNYSRSWMFGWGPYTHTGARATYVVSDKVTVIGGINNGWDQVSSTTGTKTGELGLMLTPNSMFSLATSYYEGKEVAASAGTRKFLDMVGTINATDKLNFVFDYANGSQENANLPSGTTGKAKWDALALYANYQINDLWRVSYRHETFDDKDGYRSGLLTGVGGTPLSQKLTSHTVTVGYAVAKNMELRGEVRLDKSSRNAFLQDNGIGKNSQNAVSVQAVYQF